MFNQHFFQRHWRHAVVMMVVPALLGCGKRHLEVDPTTFSAGWVSEETEHFKVYDPPQSPRRSQLKSFAESCEEAYKDLARLLSLTITEKISIYRFITNQDCESATGHAAVFIEGYRVYTRIGSPVGGAIAVAAFTSVDPEAPSFQMIRDGLREAFDNESSNIHGDVARLRSGGRWLPLATIMNPETVTDRDAYRWESASFVAYLIQTQGIERFKMLWRSVLDLPSSLEKIYGGTIQEIEDDWIAHLEREAKRT
jgi:hypothetical protein